MGRFQETFSVKNVLRAAGIAGLGLSIPLAVAPALIVSQFFKSTSSDAKLDDKVDFASRAAGISGASSSVIAMLQPTRDVLHLKIVETVACLAMAIYNRQQRAEKNPDLNRNTLNTVIGIDIVLIIALLFAKRNEDVATGKAWYKITN